MKNVISLDIGGTNFRVAKIDSSLKMIESSSSSTIKNNLDLFCMQLIEMINKTIDENSIAISLGVPGRVNSVTGYVYALPNIGISNFDLVQILFEKFRIPVYIKNDAEMAVLAESVIGAGKDYDSTYFITISTGLGGAFSFHENNVISSAEIGHTLVKYGISYYEFEEIASGTGLVKLAKLNRYIISSSKELFDAVGQNDTKAKKIYGDWLSIMKKFFNLINETFTPDIIVITGGVMKSKACFFSELQKQSKIPVLECKTGENAGLFGAAIYAFKQINQLT